MVYELQNHQKDYRFHDQLPLHFAALPKNHTKQTINHNISKIKQLISVYNYFKLSLDHFPKTNAEVEHMSKVSYAGFIGCLMYDMVFIRPYLTQAISQVFKFM